jgi:hypothetical protein
MTDSGDTGYGTAAQKITDSGGEKKPGPASKEEREAHFYARHTVTEKGEQLKPNDERLHPWPKRDRINWIAGRMVELEREISECANEREKESLEQKLEDYRTWMLKECDDLSWSKIAQNRIEQVGIPEQRSYEVSEAFEMQARRAYERVERNHLGSRLYKPELGSPENACPNCGYPWL